ncbi:unnamed protein product [Rhizopus stolonifer]
MIQFGHLNISKNEVFYESEYCVGLVNIKPITPETKERLRSNCNFFEDVPIVPKRQTARYSELSIAEITDLTLSARQVGQVIEKLYLSMKGESVWIIQDGKDAGQTIPHVHLHIIPKRYSDWPKDQDREPRTFSEMKEEADRLRRSVTFDV